MDVQDARRRTEDSVTPGASVILFLMAVSIGSDRGARANNSIVSLTKDDVCSRLGVIGWCGDVSFWTQRIARGPFHG